MTYLLRKLAEETSRRERLAKLRELVHSPQVRAMLAWDERDGPYFNETDDELLVFAARVHEIMEAY